MVKRYSAEKIFSRKCKINNSEEDYWIIRMGYRRSRVLMIGTSGEGQIVNSSELTDIQEFDKTNLENISQILTPRNNSQDNIYTHEDLERDILNQNFDTSE